MTTFSISNASLKSQLNAVPVPVLSALCDLMAKDFGIKRPKFKAREGAVKFIMDTDREDLIDFIKLAERKKVHLFERDNSLGGVPLQHKPVGKPAKAVKPSKTGNKNAVTSLADRKLLSQIRAESMAALKAVADKYGLNVDGGGGSFTDLDFTFKITYKVVGGSPSGVSASDEAGWEMLCLLDKRLKKSWLGTKFATDRGILYTIVGANARARGRTNIMLRREHDGARVKCDANFLLVNMGK